MIKTFGTITCSMENNIWRIVVAVDPEIGNYARALVPKYYRFNKQKYPAHITVARENYPLDFTCHDSQIEFEYDQRVVVGYQYLWLNVYSEQIKAFRISHLGLPPLTDYTRPPGGEDCFHITIGNFKKI